MLSFGSTRTWAANMKPHARTGRWDRTRTAASHHGRRDAQCRSRSWDGRSACKRKYRRANSSPHRPLRRDRVRREAVERWRRNRTEFQGRSLGRWLELRQSRPQPAVLASNVSWVFSLFPAASLPRAPGLGRGWLENEFLHSSRFDFAGDDLVRIAAIHHVN